MSATPDAASQPVALVIQRRIADDAGAVTMLRIGAAHAAPVATGR